MTLPSALLLALAVLAAGCSSSSGSGTGPGGGGGGGGGDGGKDGSKSTSHQKDGGGAASDAGLVCATRPHVKLDAGSDASEDARSDAKDAAVKPHDAGPVHCSNDTECPAGDVCETTARDGGMVDVCVANVGTMFCASVAKDGGASGAPGACSANADDMCCTTTAGCLPKPDASGPTCCPGAAGDLYCQKQLSSGAASCTANVCTICEDACVTANRAAYELFLGYQLTDCGCTADGACYAACHEATSDAPDSACGQCLAAQSAEDLYSDCTLTAAEDCSNDPDCTAYQACAGACPM